MKKLSNGPEARMTEKGEKGPSENDLPLYCSSQSAYQFDLM